MSDTKFMTNTRRAELVVIYRGVNITQDLKGHLTSFTFNDNEGRSDDISINLHDKNRKWQGPWLPGQGDEIEAVIRTHNWNKEKEVTELNCGIFYVDDVNFDGPPDKVSIKALSVPTASGGKNAKRSRSWDGASFSTIAGDIAVSAALTLIFDAPDVVYDRTDQSRETDLAFIKRLAKREGYAVKVTKTQLVIYQESKYEAKTPSLEFKRGDALIQTYSFKESSAEEQYMQCELQYYDEAKNKYVKYVYMAPDIREGPTLKLNKRAKNLAEAIRFAKAALRTKNKGAKTAKFKIIGHTGCVQGLTVDIKGFGAFDSKYYIETTSHDVGSGYTTNVNMREVLAY